MASQNDATRLSKAHAIAEDLLVKLFRGVGDDTSPEDGGEAVR